MARFRNIFYAHRAMLWALSFCMIAGFNSALFAQTNADCRQTLAIAKEKHNEGLFDEAIDLAKQCVEKIGLNKDIQIAAYKQITESYQAKDYQEQAKNAIKKIVEISPEYKPRPDDDPEFIEMVRIVKEEIKRSSPPDEPDETIKPSDNEDSGGGGGTKWLLIGGGAVAAGAIAYLLFRPTDSETQGMFPLPPARP